MNFYQLAEDCLFSANIEDKLASTDLAAEYAARGILEFDQYKPAIAADQVRFPGKPVMVEPRELPRRSFNTDAGRMAFLHAVAHIEFTAIHLAWDIAYRFRDRSDEFRLDWLNVAIEEARHFRALCVRLRSFGADYGHMPVHRGLWQLAENTSGDVLHRLALVPRFMEARGLDVTPGMIAKLEQADDAESVEILKMIMREEIGHVALGSFWFREICLERGLSSESEYFKLLGIYVRGEVRGPFNDQARLEAGFTQEELNLLESFQSTVSSNVRQQMDGINLK